MAKKTVYMIDYRPPVCVVIALIWIIIIINAEFLVKRHTF